MKNKVKFHNKMDNAGFKTPKIYAVNFELGYFLLEDFGQILFENFKCNTLHNFKIYAYY